MEVEVPWASSPERPNNPAANANGRPKGKLIFTVPNINKQIKENVSSKQSLGRRTEKTDWASVLAEVRDEELISFCTLDQPFHTVCVPD